MPTEIMNLTIAFSRAFRIGSGLEFGFRFDQTSVKDHHGLPYIPGSTIKGRLRSLCRRLSLTLQAIDPSYRGICKTAGKPAECQAGGSPCMICRLFGSRATPGNLRFSDARLAEGQRQELLQLKKIYRGKMPPDLCEARPQIRLNRSKGVAQHQALFCGEVVPGENLTFAGKITVVNGVLAPEEKALLLSGLKLLTHIGAQKARGLGHCTITLA